MLTATTISGPGGFGALGGNPSSSKIRALQEALRDLAEKKEGIANLQEFCASGGTRRACGGTLGHKTINALVNAFDIVPKIPSKVKTAIRVLSKAATVPLPYGTPDRIKDARKKARQGIAVAINSPAGGAITAAIRLYTNTLPAQGSGSGGARPAMFQALTMRKSPTGTAQRFPAGTVHYFDQAKKIYRIAVPKKTLSGFGAPVTHDLVLSTTDPAGAGSQLTTRDDVQSKTGTSTTPFYKKTWFLVGAGVLGIAAVGGVTYAIVRK